MKGRREAHALSFNQARDLLRDDVAEMLGLRWKRVNLTDQATMGGE